MVQPVPDVSVEDERGERSRLPPLNFQTKLTFIAQSLVQQRRLARIFTAFQGGRVKKKEF